MVKLEIHINSILRRLKTELAHETWESRRRYFNQMLRLAKSLNITEPCQELYDAFAADDKESKERRSMHIRCVKVLDAEAGTKAKDKNNILYNPPEMPDKEEVIRFFQSDSLIASDKVRLDYIILKAEFEMQYLNHSNSTIGQYRHSWLKIRQYFTDNGVVNYDESILKKFIAENDRQRGDGLLKEWKWKINRKAAYVLLEVAETGSFRWSMIQNDISCKNPELETIRRQYRDSISEKNLSSSIVYMHDYVFRKIIEFNGINDTEDLFGLSAGAVQNIIIKFSEICNIRSMSTILPFIRSILRTFHEKGLIEKDLSGMVMNGFIQRGSVAEYISVSDEKRLVGQLEYETKRNKAIILLALRLGLRDCDICNLTLNAIDWEHDKLRLIQKKTGDALILPLLPDVGNALMDYLVNERPYRNDNYLYVFLHAQAPHCKLSSAYKICSELITKLRIKPVNGSKIGVHLFRYSVAHKLLAAKVPHRVITETLGHASKESDKPYISMDKCMLRECALDLSDIGGISWTEVPHNG